METNLNLIKTNNMCLDLTSIKPPRVAEEDIIVFKHLKKTGETFRTPYRDCEIKFNEVITSPLQRDGYSVELGLHSFVSMAKCKTDAIGEHSHAVVKCVIPKGSKYYVGDFYGCRSIASDSLRYDEILFEREDYYDRFKKVANVVK